MNEGSATVAGTGSAGETLSHRLAMIRHELRTPISHIMGYSELILEEAGDKLPAGFSRDLQRIRTASQRLESLINEFFGEVRFGRHELSLSQIMHELRTPVNHIIGYSEMLQETAPELGFKSAAPDLERIQQAAATWLKMMEQHIAPLLADSQAASRLASEAAASRRVSRGDTTLLFAQAGRVTGSVNRRRRILVVDDDLGSRDMLSRRLVLHGYDVCTASGGPEALGCLRAQPFDLVLLDMLMPGMSGDQVLETMRHDPALQDVPVIMVSSMDEMDGVERCILLGAEDYLPKPFNPVLLQARIGAAIEKRSLRAQERDYLGQIRAEQEKSEALLLNVLPESIAARLKQGERVIMDTFPEVTVLFADIANFTELGTRVPGAEMVRLLDDIFTNFDLLAQDLRLEKFKTIGDAYMVVGGLPAPRTDHAQAIAELALNMAESVGRKFSSGAMPVKLRIGISSGSVIAGVIGRGRFSYDLWGDTVNTASRMESRSKPGCIQLTQTTRDLLGDAYQFKLRGHIQVKGKGKMVAWWLTGRNNPA